MWSRQCWFSNLFVLSVQSPISLPSAQTPDSASQSGFCTQLPASHSLDAAWIDEEEEQCLAVVQQVLLNSRKSSTRAVCSPKWKRFLVWLLAWWVQPSLACIQDILEYVLHLQSADLALSSVRVHLLVILAFHWPIQRKSVFSNSMAVSFLKGVTHLHPPVKELFPLRGFNSVLATIMGPPFEPLATSSFSLLC